MVTEVGVGGFIGSGDIDVSLSGVSEGNMVFCSWGPSLGFLCCIFCIVLIVVSLFFYRFYK